MEAPITEPTKIEVKSPSPPAAPDKSARSEKEPLNPFGEAAKHARADLNEFFDHTQIDGLRAKNGREELAGKQRNLSQAEQSTSDALTRTRNATEGANYRVQEIADNLRSAQRALEDESNNLRRVLGNNQATRALDESLSQTKARWVDQEGIEDFVVQIRELESITDSVEKEAKIAELKASVVALVEPIIDRSNEARNSFQTYSATAEENRPRVLGRIEGAYGEIPAAREKLGAVSYTINQDLEHAAYNAGSYFVDVPEHAARVAYSYGRIGDESERLGTNISTILSGLK